MESARKCGKKTVRISKGIEVGNIFQLGTKYTKSMKMTYVDKDGERQTQSWAAMESVSEDLLLLYVKPIMMSMVQSGQKEIAPWQVHLCAVRPDNEEVKAFADDLYEKMQNAGIEVIYDDRTVKCRRYVCRCRPSWNSTSCYRKS